MAEHHVSLISTRHPIGSLLERARAGRRIALMDRMVTIVQTSTDGQSLVEHRFPAMPRVTDLIARLGSDTMVVNVRTQRLEAVKDVTPVLAAE